MTLPPIDVLKLGQAVAEVVRAAGVTVDETRTGDQSLTLTRCGSTQLA